MKLRRINPHKIRVPEVRVNAQFDDEKAALFKDSVEGIGIDEPIKCYQVGEELWLSDGKHRLDEAIRLNMDVVEAYVREGTMVDVMCNNLMAGHLRGKHPPGEMVKVIEELYKTHKVKIEEIVKRTGLPQRYIEDLLLISELTPMGREALDENLRWFTVGHALALVKVKDPVVQERILGQQLMYHWSIAELKTFIDDVLALPKLEPAKQQELPPPPVIKCHFCGQVKELSEIANPNICTTCAGDLLEFRAQLRRQQEAEARGKSE